MVVHTYSGGAHCCHDYRIFDIGNSAREIYTSELYDSGNEIGSNLEPIDIDGDGVFEFRRSVETFSYFYASYAESNKPIAIFAYNERRKKYELANKKYPQYVLDGSERGRKWFAENKPDLDDRDRRYLVRMEFLNQIYAGCRERAWSYFDRSYHFEDRDEYRREIKKRFKADPTYRSIYGN